MPRKWSTLRTGSLDKRGNTKTHTNNKELV